jgi:hypothetical protein
MKSKLEKEAAERQYRLQQEAEAAQRAEQYRMSKVVQQAHLAEVDAKIAKGAADAAAKRAMAGPEVVFVRMCRHGVKQSFYCGSCGYI